MAANAASPMRANGASRLLVGSPDSSVLNTRKPNRPKYSRFSQQELPACKPILTPKWVIIMFTVVSIIFIPIGIAAVFATKDVVEIVYQYDQDCIPQAYSGSKDDEIMFIQSSTTDKTCQKTLTVTKKMKQPIYVYYQLDKYYQNDRRYVQDVNYNQLMDASNANDTSGCSPEDTANGSPIVPCGLIAWSLFNDTYSFVLNNIQPLTVNQTGISWKSDRDHKFGSDVYPSNFQNNFHNGTLIGGGSLDTAKPLSEQENLIVWMRTAALPNFRKLYGKIETDLQANDIIQVTLQNNYNTYSFSGKKKLVLSTTSWLGGKNDFLGIAYLTVGGLCLFLAMVFTAIYLVKPRHRGDPSYLSWNNNPGGQ